MEKHTLKIYVFLTIWYHHMTRKTSSNSEPHRQNNHLYCNLFNLDA